MQYSVVKYHTQYRSVPSATAYQSLLAHAQGLQEFRGPRLMRRISLYRSVSAS